MKGTIFDIQYYATFDGPGIRTAVFLKGCPLRCEWCHNPESWKREIQVGVTLERCVRCGQCVLACPALVIGRDQDGRPVQHEGCRGCGQCLEVCPSGARERIGEEVDSSEVVRRVERDRPFYETSGGGVTFTGGEATLQADFLLETARQLTGQGIHVALETCGLFPARLLDDLAGTMDLFLYDLKVADPQEHERATGVSNERILGNFFALVDRLGPGRVVPRIPLVPGVNTHPEAIEGFIDILRRAGHPGPVHLMPYNPLARSKWRKIGREDSYRPREPLDGPTRADVEDAFHRAGFEVEWNE